MLLLFLLFKFSPVKSRVYMYVIDVILYPPPPQQTKNHNKTKTKIQVIESENTGVLNKCSSEIIFAQFVTYL